MVSAARVTAGTSAVALNSSTSAGGRLLVTNTDEASDADLGGSDVAAGEGYPLAAGASVAVELAPGEVLYAIAASDVVLAVLRT